MLWSDKLNKNKTLMRDLKWHCSLKDVDGQPPAVGHLNTRVYLVSAPAAMH